MAKPKINLNITSNAGAISRRLSEIVDKLKQVQAEAKRGTVLNIEFRQIERLENISKSITSALGGLKDKAEEVKRIFGDIHSPMEDISKGAAEATKEVANLNKEIRKFADGKIDDKDLKKLRKDWREQLVPNADDIKNGYSRFKKIHEDFVNNFNNKQIKVEDFPHMFTQYERARNILKEANQFKGLSQIEPKGKSFAKTFEAYKNKPDIKVTIDHSKIPSQVKEVEEELSPLKRPIQIPVMFDAKSIIASANALGEQAIPQIKKDLAEHLRLPITMTIGNINEVIAEIKKSMGIVEEEGKKGNKNSAKLSLSLDLTAFNKKLTSLKKRLETFYNNKKYFNPKINPDISDFNNKLATLRKKLSAFNRAKYSTLKIKADISMANEAVDNFTSKIQGKELPLDKTVHIRADNSQFLKTVNNSLAKLKELKNITVRINSNIEDVMLKEKASKSKKKKGFDPDEEYGKLFGLGWSNIKVNKQMQMSKDLLGMAGTGGWDATDEQLSKIKNRMIYLNELREATNQGMTVMQLRAEKAAQAAEAEQKAKAAESNKAKEIEQKAIEETAKTHQRVARAKYKAEEKYNEEIARGNQLMEYGAMITQKQYDDHVKKLNKYGTHYEHFGGDPSSLAQSQVLALGSNAAEVNQANAVKNAMAWKNQFFKTADEKVNSLTSSLNTLYTQLERTPHNKGIKGYVKETEAELRKARQEAEKVQKSLETVSGKGLSKFRQEMSRHFRYIGRAFGFYESYDMLNEAGRTLMEVDENMKNLATVMPKIHGFSQEAIEELQKEQTVLLDMGSRYGTSMKDITESARLWGRMYKDQSRVNALTEQSAQLAIADNFSMEESTKAVEAAMFQFGMTARSTGEAIAYSNEIIDVYTKLSHNAGVTAQDLAAAVERSGSVAHQAGMDFEFLTALIAQGTRSTALSGLTNTSPFMLETA